MEVESGRNVIIPLKLDPVSGINNTREIKDTCRTMFR